MSLRPDATQYSMHDPATVVFHDRAYGFDSPVDREKALADKQSMQRRICYCIDSTACTSSSLVDIGTLTIISESVFCCVPRFLT